MGYYEVVRLAITLGGEELTICTKTGAIAWDECAAPVRLLSEAADVQAGMRLLSLESGSGVLPALATRRGAHVCACDHSLIGARLLRATAEANGVSLEAVCESPLPDPSLDGSFDLVLLIVPKGRSFARALLLTAYRALRPGGRIYFAGLNTAGIKSIVADAGLIFGTAATIRYKARSRVALAYKSLEMPAPSIRQDDPAWSGALQPFDAWTLRLFGAPSVFSADGVDLGTALLLEGLDRDLCGGARVLDVGCGCGVIGLYAASLGAQADLVDVNWLALACAQRGAAVNCLDGVRIWASDIYSDVDGAGYDLILSNPPFHAGHSVDTDVAIELIAGAWERLTPGGRLRIVANRFLPYDRTMQTIFGAGQVVTVAEDRRYRVLEGRRGGTPPAPPAESRKNHAIQPPR